MKKKKNQKEYLRVNSTMMKKMIQLVIQIQRKR